MPPQPLIAGNWKMNGLRRPAVAELRRLVRLAMKPAKLRPEVVICPPATLLAALAAVVVKAKAQRRIALGGQDCHALASGAHTGDLGAEMLKDAGAAFVIVGHSERRANHGESDARVRGKAEAAHRAGLTAIVCVGETLAERDAGQALGVVGRQVGGSVPDGATAANTVIAYEPVWAIGAGRTPTTDDVAKVHGFIRAELAKRFGDAGHWRLLYGGSVSAQNAAALMAVANVDGALVGGASLTAAAFWPIVQAKA
jgi:triosephosphate isomerase (TIM)